MGDTCRMSFLLVLCLAACVAWAEDRGETPGDSLADVVITGTRSLTDAAHLPLTVSTLDRATLTEHYRMTVLPTLSEQVPGLFVTSRGVLGYGVSTGAAGTIKVRGIGGNAALLLLLDGEPQYAGLYGHPIADAQQVEGAQRVEVVRGPASALYGSNAMGGVVNVVTRQAPADGSRTHVSLQGGSYGTLQAVASNSLRAGRFSSTVGIGYGRTDGHRANSEFEQLSGFAKVGYQLSAHWNTTAHANLIHFDSSNPGEVSEPMLDNDMCITRGTVALALEDRYERVDGALRVFYNWGHHHINDGHTAEEEPQTAFYIHDDLMCGLSAYQSAELLPGNETTLGVDYQHFGGEAWNKTIADASRSYLADAEEDEVAVYADFRQDMATCLTLDLALRWDHHSQVGTQWVPQGGLTWRLPWRGQLSATVAKGFRNATIRELYMFRPANDELEPERLVSYELAWRQAWMDGRLETTVNVFYIDASNLISTEMVDGSARNVNTGHTENSGFEMEAHLALSSACSLQANYSFLHMSNPQTAAPEHKLLLGARCQVGRLALRPTLQFIGGLYTATGSEASQEDFWLLDLTADYRLAEGLRLFARGENLLAQRYQTVAGFVMPRATVMAGVDWTF